jgi:beta-barrel assembly-enhancing protease
MSVYVPKPDLHAVNIQRKEKYTDILVLFLATMTMLLGSLFVVAYAIQLLAVRVVPRVEQQLVAGMGDFTPGSSIRHPELSRLLSKMKPDTMKYDVHFKIDCSNEINAYALPGGTIVFTKGLLERMKTEQGLAFVAGHEMGHLENRDHLRGAGLWFTFMVAKLFAGVGELPFFDEIQRLLQSAYSRDQESAADDFALQLMHKKYENIYDASEFFQLLQKEEALGVAENFWFLSTHPLTKLRLEKMKSHTNKELEGRSRNIQFIQRAALCEAKCIESC